MERLFERGIDPDTVDAAVPRSGAERRGLAREDVIAYGDRADAAILEVLEAFDAGPAVGAAAGCARGEAIFTALEHEAMHQETLLYMWHRLPHDSEDAAVARLRYELGGRAVT